MVSRDPLEDDELEALKETATRDLKDDVIVRVLAHCGLRASELAHMRSSWVDWQDESIRVPREQECDRACCEDNETPGVWKPKSAAGARLVPLRDPDCKRVLRQFFERNDAIDMSRATIYRRVVDVAESTDDVRRKVTPHVLRHTYGCQLASRGATQQYLKQTLGHARIESTEPYIEYTGRRIHNEADDLW